MWATCKAPEKAVEGWQRRIKAYNKVIAENRSATFVEVNAEAIEKGLDNFIDEKRIELDGNWGTEKRRREEKKKGDTKCSIKKV